MVKKKNVKKKAVVKKNQHDLGFWALLILLVGIGSYALFTMFQSADFYVNQVQTNVFEANKDWIGDGEDQIAGDLLPEDNPFVDLSVEHPHAKALMELYYKGIMNGDAAGNIRPDDYVNRAELVTIAVEAAKVDLSSFNTLGSCFEDVSSVDKNWFAAHVCAAKKMDIVSADKEFFYPKSNVTKAEALVVLMRAFEMPIMENEEVATLFFTDVSANSWYLGVAASSLKNGLILEGEKFGASKQLTRGEVAQLVYNAL